MTSSTRTQGLPISSLSITNGNLSTQSITSWANAKDFWLGRSQTKLSMVRCKSICLLNCKNPKLFSDVPVRWWLETRRFRSSTRHRTNWKKPGKSRSRLCNKNVIDMNKSQFRKSCESSDLEKAKRTSICFQTSGSLYRGKRARKSQKRSNDGWRFWKWRTRNG